MTNEELIKEEPKCIYNRTLEERKESCKYCSAFCTVRIKEEPTGEDLDEASWNYSDRDGIGYGQRYAMQIDFKAGAEWQKQQDEKLFNNDSWNYIEENYPNISQEEKIRLYDISIKSRLAGANAIKQKMMKDAVDAFVNTYENTDDGNYVEFVTEQSPYKFKETEKCKLIIIKEEQE